MNDRIVKILAQMAALEDELRTAVHEQESRMYFQIKGKRVEFERSVREAHAIPGGSGQAGLTVAAH